MKFNFNDVIVAPATSLTKQAISIIRLSGKDVFSIVNKILKMKLIEQSGTFLRKIYMNNSIIDEALILTFKAPNSFTGENVIEINCHGGILLTKKIIELLLKNGARYAMNGEFSQRAFLNGKINLIQADSINELIESKNIISLKVNASNLLNKSQKIITNSKEMLVDIISKIQTAIDYPEYDEIGELSNEFLIKELNRINREIKIVLDNSKRYLGYKKNINIAIVGEPNVGKSSLLNLLLNEDKAIVSNIEGTTRDVVEGEFVLGDLTYKLLDTAGIRKSDDPIELKGIEKSIEKIDESDLVIYLIDEKINKDIYLKFNNKKHIVALNKIDLMKKDFILDIKKDIKDICEISVKNNDINNLLNRIQEMFKHNDFEMDSVVLQNESKISELENVFNMLNKAIKELGQETPVDLVIIDLIEANNILNSLLGYVDMEEEIIDNIFKKYCLGK